MNRNNFGALIVALRKEHFNPIIGKVWGQAELAQKTGLSKKVIGDIERGNRSTLNADILLRLAGALELTTRERQQFFSLSSEVDENLIPASHDEDALLPDCFEYITTVQAPALIHDAFYNVLAVNDAWMQFYAVSDYFAQPISAEILRYNLLRFFCDPNAPLKRILGRTYYNGIERRINYFRRISLPYRHTQYFSDLFSSLLTEFDNFGRCWMSSQFSRTDVIAEIRANRFQHPASGSIFCSVPKVSVITQYGNIYYSIFTPHDAKTKAFFGELAVNNSHRLHQLSSFPVYYGGHNPEPDVLQQLFSTSKVDSISRNIKRK